MEYVQVMYASTRPVYIDGASVGDANDVLQIDPGTHKFDLGTPVDYYPASQTVLIAGTTVFQPKRVVFTQRRG